MRLPTLEKAHLSAIAISKSLNVSKDEGYQLLAKMFNYSSWCSLESKLPHQVDIPTNEIHSLNQILAEKLSNLIGVDSGSAIQELIRSISPYSTKPKAYRFDVNVINTSSDTLINFPDLRDMIELMSEGETADEAMMNSIKKFVSSTDMVDKDLFLELLNEMDFNKLQNQMRNAHPIDPVLHANALENFIGVEVTVFDEDRQLMQVGEYTDEHGEPNPLFTTPMLSMPGDSQDDEFIKYLNAVELQCDLMFEKPMVMMGTCTFKKIDDLYYAVVGVWYDTHDWRWIFLANHTPWAQKKLFTDTLIDKLENSLDKCKPPKELAIQVSQGFDSHLVWHCMVKPNERPESTGDGLNFKVESRPIISGLTGWCSFL